MTDSLGLKQIFWGLRTEVTDNLLHAALDLSQAAVNSRLGTSRSFPGCCQTSSFFGSPSPCFPRPCLAWWSGNGFCFVILTTRNPPIWHTSYYRAFLNRRWTLVYLFFSLILNFSYCFDLKKDLKEAYRNLHVNFFGSPGCTGFFRLNGPHFGRNKYHDRNHNFPGKYTDTEDSSSG